MAYGNNDRNHRDDSIGKQCDIIRSQFDKEFPKNSWGCEIERLMALVEYTMEFYTPY